MEPTTPIIAHITDIDREFAIRAFTNTSFHPDRRGEQARREYADFVNGLYAELWPLAKTDEQKQLLADEMERYRQGYLTRQNAYLASHANCASSFVVGPARFPTARMQKRSRWADNKANALLVWSKKAQKAIRRKVLQARPQEEKDAAEWRAVCRDIQGNLRVIAAIDAGTEPYTRSAFVHSIVGKVERLAINGKVELTRKALQLVREYNQQHRKPAITGRHQFWTFEQRAKDSANKAETRAVQTPKELARGEAVVILERPDIDRIQIQFAEKPPVDMLAKLKGEAWKWSPKEKVWQRKLTTTAIQSAKQICEFEA